MNALGPDPVTAGLASDYLLWFVPAMSLQFGIVAMGAALRGTGNFRPGMIVSTASVILNIVLAPFLIFGWVTHRPYGVSGAAISTLVSVAVASVWLTLYFLPRDSYLTFVRRAVEAQSVAVEEDAGHRSSRGRGIRACSRSISSSSTSSAARSARRRRRDSASACASCRRGSCQLSRWASPSRQSPVRTLVRVSRRACVQPFARLR